MGCGASKDQKIGVADSIKTRSDYNYNNNSSNKQLNGGKFNNQNGFKQVDLRRPQQQPPAEIKPPLAFVISFDENKNGSNFHRPPPGRLRLDPIKPKPQITQKKLEEKMRNVELNREKILAERVKSSTTKKRRRSAKQPHHHNQQQQHMSASSHDSGYNNRDRDRDRDRDREYNQRESSSRHQQTNDMRQKNNNNRYDDYESSSSFYNKQDNSNNYQSSSNNLRYNSSSTNMTNMTNISNHNNPNNKYNTGGGGSGIGSGKEYHRGNDSGIGADSPSSLRDDDKRQRLLRQRRLITNYNDDYDSDIEHDRNYNRDSGNYF